MAVVGCRLEIDPFAQSAVGNSGQDSAAAVEFDLAAESAHRLVVVDSVVAAVADSVDLVSTADTARAADSYSSVVRAVAGTEPSADS